MYVFNRVKIPWFKSSASYKQSIMNNLHLFLTTEVWLANDYTQWFKTVFFVVCIIIILCSLVFYNTIIHIAHTRM